MIADRVERSKSSGTMFANQRAGITERLITEDFANNASQQALQFRVVQGGQRLDGLGNRARQQRFHRFFDSQPVENLRR